MSSVGLDLLTIIYMLCSCFSSELCKLFKKFLWNNQSEFIEMLCSCLSNEFCSVSFLPYLNISVWDKLSRSLIPIFQCGGGGHGKDNGTLTKLGKRNTKWGPDLTQDAAVKKSRVLAYQVRVQDIR